MVKKSKEKRCDCCGVYSRDEKHMFCDMYGCYCSDCWQVYLNADKYDTTRCHDEEVA